MKRTAIVLHHRLLFLGVLVLLAAGAMGTLAAGAEVETAGKRVAASAAGPQAAPDPATLAPAVAATTEKGPDATPLDPGMRAFIDPETGQLGAPPVLPPLTPEEQASLNPESDLQPVQITLPDGSVMVDLKGTCQEYSVMQLDADGRKVVRCVHDPKTALQNPAPAPQREDR